MKKKHKSQLLQIFTKSISAVSGAWVVSRHLEQHPLSGEKIDTIAIGKAASSMLTGALNSCGEQVDRALLITRQGHVDASLFQDTRVDVIESAHPYPDERTLEAGRALLAFLKASPPDRPLLFLISGGASSLVDVIDEKFGAGELKKVNEWLLASGYAISEINQVRKSISNIKAGRLARNVEGRSVTQLLISDVAGDDPAVIGSGLLVPHTQDVNLSDLPDWIYAMTQSIEPPPVAHDPCFANIDSHVIATNEMMRQRTAVAASEAGFTIHCNEPVYGDWQKAAQNMAQTLMNGEPGVYIWGGEVTVTLPDSPGKGGRCQMMALYLAQQFVGQENIMVFAAGSDGSDGPTEVAGALIDGQSIERAAVDGLDAQQHITGANAYAFLQASGDLIDTGPTGTNVMDLIIALKTY